MLCDTSQSSHLCPPPRFFRAGEQADDIPFPEAYAALIPMTNNDITPSGGRNLYVLA